MSNVSNVRGSSEHKQAQEEIKKTSHAIREAIKVESETVEQLRAQEKELRTKLAAFKCSVQFPVGEMATALVAKKGVCKEGDKGMIVISGLSHAWLFFTKGIDGKPCSERFAMNELAKVGK